MSVMAMKRLNICGMKRDRESIIETINEFKAMELDESAFQNKNLSDFPTNDQRITFEKKAHKRLKCMRLKKRECWLHWKGKKT